MLALIEMVAGILDAWYARRLLAILAAGASLVFGLSFLAKLPSSADFNGDLARGLGYLALAVILTIAAIRSRKRDT